MTGANLAFGYGKGELDILVGDAGRDLFILGGADRYYYNDEDHFSSGDNDYARIIGFSTSFDRIQLQGDASEYILKSLGAGSPLNLGSAAAADTGIFRRNGVLFGKDELIAVVQDVSGLNLGSSYFSYLS